MQHNQDSSITLDMVNRQLKSGPLTLRFSPQLEATFERDTCRERDLAVIRGSMVALILYDIFLVNDWLAMPDVFGLLAIFRLGIFTPVALVSFAAIYYARRCVVRETLNTFMCILAIALPMTAVIVSSSPERGFYQHGTLLIMMFMTVIQRMRFRYAIVGLGAIISIMAIATYVGNVFDAGGFAANLVFFATAAALLLFGTFVIERDNRRTYLHSLRGSLLLEQVERATRIDPLTGLYNRRHLTHVHTELWSDATASPQIVCAVGLDIDHFKSFNDSNGHLEGDKCLIAISACIKEAIAPHGELAFRLGGEEMLVLLPGMDPSVARQVAEDIAQAIRHAAIPHPALGPNAIVSASMGVAGVIAPESSLTDLVGAADTALYAAKHAGRNCIWPPLAVARTTEQSGIVAA